MVVAREHYADLIARAFDGAIVVDGQRVIAHRSGMHVVRDDRAGDRKAPSGERPPSAGRMADDRSSGRMANDRDNDWSDV